MSARRVIIENPRVFYAPIPEAGQSPMWQSMGSVVGISMDITPDPEPILSTGELAGGFSFTFVGTPKLHRLWKILRRRSPAEVRRSSMRTAYHRRQKRRSHR